MGKKDRSTWREVVTSFTSSKLLEFPVFLMMNSTNTMTITVPDSNVDFTQIELAFPGGGSSLGHYRGQHPSLPAAGVHIGLGSFKHLTAVSPTHILAPVSGTNVTMDATGSVTGAIDSTHIGVISVLLSSYLSDPADYHKGLTYIVTSGTLPTGFTLDSTSGLLSSSNAVTDTGGVRSSVVVTVTNGWGNTATIPLSFTFTSNTNTSITGSSLGTVSGATTHDITQTNVNAGTVTWATTGGPTGTILTNKLNTGCTLSVAYVPGIYTIVVTSTGANGVVSSANFSVTIISAFTNSIIVGRALGTFTNSTSFRINQTNSNAGSVTWTITGAPSGTSFSAKSNTQATVQLPFVHGTYTVIVTATGSNGVGASANFTMTMAYGVSIIGANLGNFTNATTYTINQTIVHNGGVTWANTGGPSGTALTNQTNSMCTLSIPFVYGTYTIVVTATGGGGEAVSSANFTITMNYGNTSITGSSLGTIHGNASYAIMQTTANTGTVNWVTSGGPPETILMDQLDTGCTLSIQGETLPIPGTYTIVVTATGANGVVSSANYDLIVIDPYANINYYNFGAVGHAITYAIMQTNTSGAVGTVAWTITGGPVGTTLTNQLDTGCTLNAPFVLGTYTITVTAQGNNGIDNGCSANYDVVMVSNASITGVDLGTVSDLVLYDITQTSIGTGTVVWGVTGGPAGTTLMYRNDTGCTLHVPYIPGAYTIIVTAKGADGVVSSASYPLLMV